VGPTEFVRGGTVIETERVFPAAIGALGDGGLGRLFRFSAKRPISTVLLTLLEPTS